MLWRAGQAPAGRAAEEKPTTQTRSKRVRMPLTLERQAAVIGECTAVALGKGIS